MFETLGVIGSGALDLLGTGASASMPFVGDFIKGATSNYWNNKALKKSYKYAYDYAERYARNSPTWNVEGLRAAGLNPLLAVSKGFSGGSPSSVSSPSVDTNSRLSASSYYDNQLQRKQLELMEAEIKGQKIRNENEEANRGLDGKWGAISRLISEGTKQYPSVSEYLQNSPLLTIEKKANANIESYTDDERKALILLDILQSQGYDEVEARHQGGEKFWEHLESAWSKRRRNVRATRKR